MMKGSKFRSTLKCILSVFHLLQLTLLPSITSPIRAHLVQIQIPPDEDKMHAMIEQLHGELKVRLESHMDSNGHTVNEHDAGQIIGEHVRYADLLGETGSTYYLRRRFNPEPSPNWALHNEAIMDAFYDKHSIRSRATIMATKCGAEWVHESLISDA